MGNNSSRENQPVMTNQYNGRPYYENNYGNNANDARHAEFNQYANKVYDDTRRQMDFTDPRSSHDSNREFPYYSDSKTWYHPVETSSENPRYVELLVCGSNVSGVPIEGNPNVVKERWAVHNGPATHDCGPNCHCIKEIHDIGPKQTYLDRNSIKAKLDSRELEHILSPTSSEPSEFYRNIIIVEKKMHGGAGNDNDDVDAETSPEDITDSDEQVGSATTTSEMSATSSVPAIGERKVKQTVGDVITDNKLIFDSENMNNSDNNNNNDDEEDEDNQVLEGLDTSEGGYVFGSDITSSDLYKLKDRFFKSETESIGGLSDDNNSDSDSDTDTDSETTENVRIALNNINSRKNSRKGSGKSIFDTEDRNILNLNSTNSTDSTDSTDSYRKRSTRKSHKYA